jgi:hypothetical protein
MGVGEVKVHHFRGADSRRLISCVIIVVMACNHAGSPFIAMACALGRVLIRITIGGGIQ